jgi:hypothetical protein
MVSVLASKVVDRGALRAKKWPTSDVHIYLQEIISIQKINNKSYIDSYDVIIIYFLCQALFLCKICGQFDRICSTFLNIMLFIV